MSRRDKFPNQPETLPIDGLDPSVPRFDPDQLRAFGSVPKMLRDDSQSIRFEDLSSTAWERSAPEAINDQLFGVEDRYSVNGLAFSAEYYEAIIRSQSAFEASIRGKTIKANRQSNYQRRTEKELHSAEGALASKDARHTAILATLAQQREVLDKLMEMQRTPGFHRQTMDVDVRGMAATAREIVFDGMLRAVADNRGIPDDELSEVGTALDYRLLEGGSRVRMEEWGKMLQIGNHYTRSLQSLFIASEQKIERAQREISEEIESRGFTSHIRSRGSQALNRTIEM